MGRGFLSGIFWGGIVGIVLLFVSGAVLDRQQLSLPQPQASAVEVPGGSEFDQARPETEPVLPSSDGRPASGNAAGVALQADDQDAPPALDTTALEVPVPATTQDAPDTLGDAPGEVSDADEPATAADEAISSAVSDALETPDSPGDAPVAESAAPTATEAEASEDTVPELATTADLAVETDDVAALPTAGETGEAGAQPDNDQTPAVSSQSNAPAALNAPASDDGSPALAASTDADTQVGQAPETPALPQVTTEPSLPPAGTAPAAIPTVELDTSEPAVQETAEDAGQDAGQEPGQAASGTNTENTETAQADTTAEDAGNLPVVRRLGNSQSQADDTAETEATEDVVAEAEPVEQADPPAGPALQVFANSFENTQALPLLTVVLLHEDTTDMSPEVLNSLPANVAFAVDASASNAGDVAAFYRKNDREVVMIPSLPAGAAPQDVEQALSVNFDRIPQAVAVMDVSGSSFQSDRAAVAQVVDVVSDTGHGLITFPRGLNTAHQEAQRAGVPTGLISRNLDSAGDDIERIRRSMDRAAFRARQDEAVILVGTATPMMLSAIIEWFAGNRAAQVVLAPVSAALVSP